MRLDGEPAAARDLERMANALSAYGPDRANVALAGSVGFAHVLMRMTPEDRFDRQPLRGSAGELLTADLRLDNRDEILDRLGINRTIVLPGRIRRSCSPPGKGSATTSGGRCAGRLPWRSGIRETGL